jgi:hypothetical protein
MGFPSIPLPSPSREHARMADILAIDVATQTGWARGCVGSDPIFGTISFGKLKGGDPNEIFATALDWMLGYLVPPIPDEVILEAMLPPTVKQGETNRGTRDRLAGLHGVIRAVAFNRGVRKITDASTSKVRDHFIGQSGLARKQAKAAVKDRCRALGWNVANDDEGDACALWHYACALIDPTQALRVTPLFNKKLRVTIWP